MYTVFISEFEKLFFKNYLIDLNKKPYSSYYFLFWNTLYYLFPLSHTFKFYNPKGIIFFPDPVHLHP